MARTGRLSGGVVLVGFEPLLPRSVAEQVIAEVGSQRLAVDDLADVQRTGLLPRRVWKAMTSGSRSPVAMLKTSWFSLGARSTSIPVRSVNASTSPGEPSSPRGARRQGDGGARERPRAGIARAVRARPPRNGRPAGTSTVRRAGPERNDSHSASVSCRSTADSASSTNSFGGRAYTPTRPWGPDLTATGVSLPTSYCTPSSWSAKCTHRPLPRSRTRGRRFRAPTAPPATARAPDHRRVQPPRRRRDRPPSAGRPRPPSRRRRTPLHRAEHGERGHEDGHEPDPGQLTHALPLAAFGRDGPQLALADLLELSVALGDAGVEEASLGAGQWQRGGGGPAVHLFEQAASQEIRLGAVGGDPLTHRLRESALIAHIVAGAVDPAPQPCPLGEQRFVRDLDRRAPRDRSGRSSTGGGDRTYRASCGASRDRRRAVRARCGGRGDGCRRRRLQRDEPEEDLPGDLVRPVAEAGQQPLAGGAANHTRPTRRRAPRRPRC